ncbi:nitronate monooxygenase [uncultured Rikenella sp.]|uniref:NAD(P)H-dependent flavin oxidoreductase n=1 Tax=uncultured Rikenella sp. TaxID=368003 RepID=UPI00262D6423|nr:nitronate monooxygenase [uncultured Rikenella sp.]
MKTTVTELFKIEHPIVSGGMVWCSGWRLASAVSASGGLGLLGAGSMHPETLAEHIAKTRAALADSGRPFGVNVPLFYPEIERVIQLLIDERVPIVFTSGGNPALYTGRLKEAGITVAHVVASARFAQKAEAAGVDAIVAEGFEAGGHNGREEITTMALIPQVRAVTGLPLLAAGGIATGAGMLAVMALGADGVQLGTRFALAAESSAHEAFKQLCVTIGEGDTMLALKKLSPVRMIKNEFYRRVAEAEARGASAEELRELLGAKRSKRGIFEGDLTEGELEIGQIASLIREVEPVAEIMRRLVTEFDTAAERIGRWKTDTGKA